MIWLDERTLLAGRGRRSNEEGIGQLRTLLADAVDEVVTVDLPDWRGPGDVFHLMSILSLIDRDLALLYAPLAPPTLHRTLQARGCTVVEVPEEEFGSMAPNVLTVGPRECVMLSGNPVTRARLEQAGARVHVVDGEHISRRGAGGPTCLTRPMERRR
ncbi:MAG: arginine deiminase family protein [Planctomycetota bacterium]